MHPPTSVPDGADGADVADIFAGYVAARSFTDRFPLRLDLSPAGGLPGWVSLGEHRGADLWHDPRFGLPFDDGSVDLIVAIGLLETQPLPIAGLVLAEARRVLRPGGILRLAVPPGHADSVVAPLLPELLDAVGFAEVTRRGPGISDHPALRGLVQERGCALVLEAVA